MLLIIVTGPPCSGKTTLARHIADKTYLPLVAKDDIKETLFNALGWKDREWSKRLGTATFELLFYYSQALLSAGCSHIIEANFIPDFHNARFLELKQKYAFETLEIHCHADQAVLRERFHTRSESGRRHPGHVDHLNYAEFDNLNLNERHRALNIGGTVLEIDTTAFKIDYTTLYAAIQSARGSTLG